MKLQPCDACPRFTYNGRSHDGTRLCSGCNDALLFVQSQPIDELRDLIGELPTRPTPTGFFRAGRRTP